MKEDLNLLNIINEIINLMRNKRKQNKTMQIPLNKCKNKSN